MKSRNIDGQVVESDAITAQPEEQEQTDASVEEKTDLQTQMKQFIPHLSVAILTFAAQNPNIWDLIFTDGGKPKHY
jgi:hypothetical protein